MLVVLSILRITVPLLVFVNPIIGVAFSTIIDIVDWLVFPLGESGYVFYQQWDKILDTFASMIFSFYVWKNWKKSLAKNIAMTLMAVRFVGVVLFLSTDTRIFLFMFPNLFDTFFVFMEILRDCSFMIKQKLLRLTGMLLVLKLVQEYFVHILQKMPWELEIGQIFGGSSEYALYLNMLIWSSLFVGLHIGVYINETSKSGNKNVGAVFFRGR